MASSLLLFHVVFYVTTIIKQFSFSYFGETSNEATDTDLFYSGRNLS